MMIRSFMPVTSRTSRLLCLALALLVPVPAAAAITADLAWYSCCCWSFADMQDNCPCELDQPGEAPPKSLQAHPPSGPSVPTPESMATNGLEMDPAPSLGPQQVLSAAGEG